MKLRLHASLALGCVAVGAPAADFSALDALVPAEMTRWDVPGLAIVVVREGEVAYLRGFGVADLATGTPVTPDTAFLIASNTKAFTTTVLAQLAARGRLSWDAPVRERLPTLRLPEPLEGRLTLRDAVSHRAGLGEYAGDLLWWNGELEPAELLGRLRHLEVVGEFRGGYAYCNILYAVAAAAIETATGETWADAIAGRVLEPLGMRATHPTLETARAAGAALARGHAERDGVLTPVEPTSMRALPAAGAMVSTARDYAAWLRVQLAGGAPLLAPEAHRELLRPAVMIPVSEKDRARMPERIFRAVGLGWFVHDFRGRELFHHGGALDGMFCQTSFVPATGTAVTVFTNKDHHGLALALNYAVHDLVLNDAPGDWSERFHRRSSEREPPAPPIAAGPAFAPAEVVGEYDDPFYGAASIASEDGALVLRLSHHPDNPAALEPRRGNLAIAAWRDWIWRESVVTFSQGFDGRIDGFSFSVRPEWIDTRVHRFVRRKETAP